MLVSYIKVNILKRETGKIADQKVMKYPKINLPCKTQENFYLEPKVPFGKTSNREPFRL